MEIIKQDDLTVSQDMAIVLRRREDIEKDHLSETCLAAENASALGAEERQNRENRAAFAILATFVYFSLQYLL